MNFPNDEDGRALATIAATGMDMTKPIPIHFAIASRDEKMSEAINQALETNGYNSIVHFDKGEPDFADGDGLEFGPSWTVYAMVVVMPTYDNVIRIQNELNSLVASFEGNVDGWEIELVD